MLLPKKRAAICDPAPANENSGESPSLTSCSQSGNAGEGENAKGIDGASSAQIQQSKDFIWEHLESHAQAILMDLATKNPEERKHSYIKKIVARMEAKESGGLLVEERLIIGLQDIQQLSPDKMELI